MSSLVLILQWYFNSTRRRVMYTREPDAKTLGKKITTPIRSSTKAIQTFLWMELLLATAAFVSNLPIAPLYAHGAFEFLGG